MRRLLQALEDVQVPYHAHDCKTCRWYGSYVSLNMDRWATPDAQIYDVWVHYYNDVAGTSEDDCIILRSSSEGPAYQSFPRRIAETLSCMDPHDPGEFGLALSLIRAKKTHRWHPWEGPDPTGEPLNYEYVSRPIKHAQIDLTDNHGGRYVNLTVLEIWEGAQDQAEGILRRQFPSTFCQHGYDGCGHYYAGSPKIRRQPSGRYIVSQQFTQNV